VKVGKDIYCCGQIGMDPATNVFAGPDVNAQATQVLKNLKSIVEAAGSDMEHVLKVNIYFKDLNDFNTVNDIYKDYFPGLKPARVAIQVARLPKDALVEMDCVAVAKE
jgi:2-iminobutanoate/2-iminopropanoate deaminase